ncbi:MAG TPA: hypothetical protein VMU53_09995 [Candidatus Sulfotelmatobacter sp.]|jgi:hypothetical protein|nr:hypothetical protein [Candidatus Sulfotelmatobacter sp.]
MKITLAILSGTLLAFPVVCTAQSVQPARSKKTVTKAAAPAAKPVEPAAKPVYAELTISELVGEDANRWSDKMSSRAAIGGFITQISKSEEGDTDVRICENPKIEGMDRARCIVAKCIPKLPCDLPQLGHPVTVKGITRYDAKVGTHWWEIQPIEEVEK